MDEKVFINFLRMMTICVTQKEALHQDVNLDMIFDKLFEYVFERDVTQM